jgi:hypothetical protein
MEQESLVTPCQKDRIADVEGPLSITRIEIRDGKARILRSPFKLKVSLNPVTSSMQSESQFVCQAGWW